MLREAEWTSGDEWRRRESNPRKISIVVRTHSTDRTFSARFLLRGNTCESFASGSRA
jgi:hypothetical protein